MNSTFIEILIEQLQTELKAAKRIDAERIAEEIHRTGFGCLMCGKCCRRGYGDNRVAVLPEDIRRILDDGELTWNDVAEPFCPDTDPSQEECSFQAEYGMIDEDGNIHTFGWMLRRKDNLDCIFIPDATNDNRCKVYQRRPFLCSTYPFYMQELELRTSECEGLGGNIGLAESRELADMVLKRYLCEIRDTILTYENYDTFGTDPKGKEIAEDRLRQGYLNYIVHSREGKCKVTKYLDFSLSIDL